MKKFSLVQKMFHLPYFLSEVSKTGYPALAYSGTLFAHQFLACSKPHYQFNCAASIWTHVCAQSRITSPALLTIQQQSLIKSWKSTSSKYSRGKEGKSQDNDDDYDEDTVDPMDVDPALLTDVDGKDIKVIKAKLNSLRLDTLLKAGLNIAKNKVELAFYESRIRVNGEKVLKKSKRLNVGDEVDVIKGVNNLNSAFLDISRVNIITADVSDDMEKIVVILKRYKSLTIENYSEPYKKLAPNE